MRGVSFPRRSYSPELTLRLKIASALSPSASAFPADMLDPVVKLAQECYGADEVAEPPA